MNISAFTIQARALVAASEAEREARIAALVARADFGAWQAELERVES